MANWWEEGAFSQSDVVSTEIDEPAAEKPASSASSTAQSQGSSWRSVIILALVAVLVFAVRGLDLWQDQELTTESQRNELRRTIAMELAARRQGNAAAYRKLLDPQADEKWRQKQGAALTALPLPIPGEEPPIIEHWQFREDTAMVELRFPGPPATRETRFYRITTDGWRRTSPIAAFWGSRRNADAPGIRFIYREIDAEAVRDTIEALRTAHRQGDVPVLAGDLLTVEIVPDYVVEYQSRDNRLILPSPKLSPHLASVSDSVPILWRLAHPVADRLADPGDAVRYRYLDSVQLLRDHLRYWLLRWQAPFPQRWEIQMLDTLRAARDDNDLIVPRAIDMFSANRRQAYLAYYETLAMVDYLVEEYGSAKLLDLVVALDQTHSWDRAVPLALGVNIAEFERGWRAYLDARLGPLPTETPQPTPATTPQPSPDTTAQPAPTVGG